MDFIGTGVTPPASPILQGGFANLASFLVRLVTVIGGLFATWNFIAAGYKFMNAGEDPEAITKAWGSIWKSLIGLLLIVASFVFAAFIGWIFLGSPTAIIAPDFSTTPPVIAPPSETVQPTSLNITSGTYVGGQVTITVSGAPANADFEWLGEAGASKICGADKLSGGQASNHRSIPVQPTSFSVWKPGSINLSGGCTQTASAQQLDSFTSF